MSGAHRMEFERWWALLEEEPEEPRRRALAYDQGVNLVTRVGKGESALLELWRERVRARWPDLERDVAKLLRS